MLQVTHRTPVVLLAQYHPRVWIDRTFASEQRRATAAVLDRAKSLGLATVDTYPRFAAEPPARSFYVNSHMSPRGNATIASLLAARLPNLSEASDK